MNIPSTSSLIKKYDLNAKKSLGQNFILDSNLTDKIARSAGDISDSRVLEIGPGPGGLTSSILKQSPKKLVVVEQDQRFIPALEEIQSFYEDKLEIVKGDAIKIEENDLLNNKKFKIIANLPYNIGTLLIFKWLRDAKNIESITILLQKEVVERIVAKPGTKKYGRLSVMINFLCETKSLFDVKPSCFVPPPKVTSSVVQIIPRKKPIMDVDLKILEKICATAFGQRRKMIKSSLKSLGVDVEDWLKSCNINSSFRPEQLTLEQFGLLAMQFRNCIP